MENSLKAKLQTSIWGRHSQGFLIPLFIETFVHVSLEHRLFFAAFVRRNQFMYFEPARAKLDSSEILTLITDFQGTIFEASKSVFETFNLPTWTFSSGEVQISEIFEYGHEDEEKMATEGVKLPIDITAVSKRLNPELDKTKTWAMQEEEEDSLYKLSSNGIHFFAFVFLKRS